MYIQDLTSERVLELNYCETLGENLNENTRSDDDRDDYIVTSDHALLFIVRYMKHMSKD